jgi:hypothetical protein
MLMSEYRDKQQDININTQINTIAEQAKNELLADIAASMAHEDNATKPNT